MYHQHLLLSSILTAGHTIFVLKIIPHPSQSERSEKVPVKAAVKDNPLLTSNRLPRRYKVTYFTAL